MFWVITKKTLALGSCTVLLLIACLSTAFGGGVPDTLPAASTGMRELPIYSVETGEKKVAISFNAASGASDTDALLGILAAHQVKATFFLCGCWIRNHPEEARKLYNAGHEIGNHGDQHLDPIKLTLEDLRKEIGDQAEELQKQLGITPVLYRPASGSYNNEVVRTARNMGYEVVQWSVDSLDWKEESVEAIIENVLENEGLENGAILMFHNDTAYTAQALDSILTGLEQRGYRICCVSDLIYPPPYELDHRGRQFSVSAGG